MIGIKIYILFNYDFVCYSDIYNLLKRGMSHKFQLTSIAIFVIRKWGKLTT